MNNDIENDFGFTFVEDTSELLKEESENDKAKIEILEEKLDLLYNSILPFLDNLCKNPDKTTIVWPNRVEKIKDFKEKLYKIAYDSSEDVREGSDVKYNKPTTIKQKRK
jgi:hypothetical protein